MRVKRRRLQPTDSALWRLLRVQCPRRRARPSLEAPGGPTSGHCCAIYEYVRTALGSALHGGAAKSRWCGAARTMLFWRASAIRSLCSNGIIREGCCRLDGTTRTHTSVRTATGYGRSTALRGHTGLCAVRATDRPARPTNGTPSPVCIHSATAQLLRIGSAHTEERMRKTSCASVRSGTPELLSVSFARRCLSCYVDGTRMSIERKRSMRGWSTPPPPGAARNGGKPRICSSPQARVDGRLIWRGARGKRRGETQEYQLPIRLEGKATVSDLESCEAA
jgi:hypothetical protein